MTGPSGPWSGMTGPLSGIKIIDLSVAISGPLAVGILADQGADVIKIEQPGIGDIARFVGVAHNGISAMFQIANRGKRSVVLDLRDERAIGLLRDLCRTADVFVQNFRPGVAERMGIGYVDLKALRADIVYVSVSGFGDRGPLAHKRVYDNVVQAQSGLTYAQADPASGEPQFLRQLAADKITALTGAQAISAALFARERGRGGQHIRLAMLDAAIAFLWVDCAGNETLVDNTAGRPSSAAGTMSLMRVADGFATATPLADSEFHGFCRSFGVDSSDPDLATIGDRMRNAEKLRATLREVNAAAATTPLAEAMARMETNDVPCGVAVTVDQLPHDPQVIANELLTETVHPALGRVQQPRTPARFDGTPAQHGPHAPTLGQHTDEVLRELGIGDGRIATLRSEKVVA